MPMSTGIYMMAKNYIDSQPCYRIIGITSLQNLIIF